MTAEEIKDNLREFVTFNRVDLDKIRIGQPDVYAAVTNVLSAIDKKYCGGEAIPLGAAALLKAVPAEAEKKLLVEEGQLFVNSVGAKFLISTISNDGLSALTKTIQIGRSPIAKTGAVVSFAMDRIERWIKTGEWKLEAQTGKPQKEGMQIPDKMPSLKNQLNAIDAIVGKILIKPNGDRIIIQSQERINKKTVSYKVRDASTGKLGNIRIDGNAAKKLLEGKDLKGWRLGADTNPTEPKTEPKAPAPANTLIKKMSEWNSDWRNKGYRPSVQRSAAATRTGELGMGYNGFVYQNAEDSNGTRKWVKTKLRPMDAAKEFSRQDIYVLYDQLASGLTAFDPTDDEYKELQDNLNKLLQLMK